MKDEGCKIGGGCFCQLLRKSTRGRAARPTESDSRGRRRLVPRGAEFIDLLLPTLCLATCCVVILMLSVFRLRQQLA